MPGHVLGPADVGPFSERAAAGCGRAPGPGRCRSRTTAGTTPTAPPPGRPTRTARRRRRPARRGAGPGGGAPGPRPPPQAPLGRGRRRPPPGSCQRLRPPDRQRKWRRSGRRRRSPGSGEHGHGAHRRVRGYRLGGRIGNSRVSAPLTPAAGGRTLCVVSIRLLGPVAGRRWRRRSGTPGPRGAGCARRPPRPGRRGRVAWPTPCGGSEPPASWAKVVQGCVVRLRRDARPARHRHRTPAATASCWPVTTSTPPSSSGSWSGAGRRPPPASRSRRRRRSPGPLALWRGAPFEDLDGWAPGRGEAGRAARSCGARRRRTCSRPGWPPASTGRWWPRPRRAWPRSRCGSTAGRSWPWPSCGAGARPTRCARCAPPARRWPTTSAIEPGPELAALEEAILRQDPALAPGADALPAATECPYKGLAPYEVADADSFFGRDGEIAACLRRLDAVPPAGRGRTVGLREVVAGARRAGPRPHAGRAGRVVVFVPGADPDGRPRQRRSAGAERRPGRWSSTSSRRRSPSTTPEAGRARSAPGWPRTPPMSRRSSSRCGPTTSPSLGADPRFTELAERGLHLVRPLEGDALRAAIEGPAAQAGLRLERGLVDLLVRDTEGEPGALPLLSHALAETWAAARRPRPDRRGLPGHRRDPRRRRPLGRPAVREPAARPARRAALGDAAHGGAVARRRAGPVAGPDPDAGAPTRPTSGW